MTQGRYAPALEGYETTAQAAARLGVTQKYLTALCANGLIPGARLEHSPRAAWYVPAGAARPRSRYDAPPEGYESVAAAAARLGVGETWFSTLLYQGRVQGAIRATGGRGRWYVPINARVTGYTPRPRARGHYHEIAGARCDCCGIILTRSGDDKHPNDAPDAVRCWSCREEYGLGPLAPEITMDGGDV